MPEADPHPYRTSDGWPHLRESWVLYLDALGTKDAAAAVTDHDLFEIVNAEAWYRRFLHHHDMESVQQSLHFTDDIVVARPDDAGCAESLKSLLDLLLGVGVYVVGMALGIGRTVRGGFARGPACIDLDPLAKDGAARFNVAHGDGLIRAVVLEQQRAKVPRVVVGDQAVAHVEACLAGLGDPLESFVVPQPRLLVDTTDKETFVDHLGAVLSDTEPNLNLRDDGAPMERLTIANRYRAFIVSNLDHPVASAKYRWLAEYYDYTIESVGIGTPIGVGNSQRFNSWTPASGD